MEIELIRIEIDQVNDDICGLLKSGLKPEHPNLELHMTKLKVLATKLNLYIYWDDIEIEKEIDELLKDMRCE
jgi:hypothetical protein